jgi:tRNA-dihydrouridine synthase
MGVTGNNATAPGPAIAPGVESIDARRAAEEIGARGMDPRVRAVVPAFDAPFFQAGLAGYSDAAMRLIARREGCPFCVTEALLDRTLLAGGRGFTKADLGELHDNVPGGEDDHPLACQIMGSDPLEMAASAVKVAEQGRRGDKAYRMMAYPDGVFPTVEECRVRLPGGQQLRVYDPSEGLGEGLDETCETTIDEANVVEEVSDAAAASGGVSGRTDGAMRFETIDVNLACPVKKIKSKARGGHWLAEPEGAIRILEAVRGAVPRGTTCTVKLRRSFDDTPEMTANFERIFEAAFAMGYAWATVHARTVEQKYIGPSRWTFLKELVTRHPDKVIFGSGDVWGVEDIFRMLAYTGVSAVAVARGCIGNPWIFRQAREMMAGRAPRVPTIAEQRRVLEDHFGLALRVNGRMRRPEEHTGMTMRKFGIRFSAHHPNAEEVRRGFIAVNSTDGWRRVLDEHYRV